MRVRCDSVHLLITKIGCNSTGAYPGASPGCMLLARCMLMVKGGLLSHACIRPYVLAFLPGNFSMHVEQVGVPMGHFLPCLDLMVFELGVIVISWCAGLESRATHSVLWRGAGESSHKLSAPPLHNWHWNFH